MKEKKNKVKPIMEPAERFEHRMRCPALGSYNMSCYRRSGGGNGFFIDMGCSPNAGCRRMKIFDTKHGLAKDVTYIEDEIY